MKTSFLPEIIYSKRKCFSTLYWPLVVPIQLITSPEHAANFQRSDGGYSKGHPIPPSKSPVQQLGHKPLPQKERTKSFSALLPLLVHESADFTNTAMSPWLAWSASTSSNQPTSFLDSQILLWVNPVSPAHAICFP